jgi:hypothetical protein
MCHSFAIRCMLLFLNEMVNVCFIFLRVGRKQRQFSYPCLFLYPLMFEVMMSHRFFLWTR